MKLIKKIYFLIIIIALFNSCKKEEEKNTMDFKITGVTNTSIILGKTQDIGLKVFFLGGNKEEVKITATGMPAGVTVNFSPDKGEPDFTLTETIHANLNADTGNFVITITGTSVDNNKTFSKSFNLSVLPVPNSLPVISLFGGSNIVSTLNAAYIDSGFVAYDAEDGNITSNVIVYGSVNKDSAATYRISYVVYDSDGDKDSVVRTVRIKNAAEFMNGSYTCNVTAPSGFPDCITDIFISGSVNNRVTLANGVNCYTPNLDLDIIQTGHQISIPVQSWFYQGTTHTYSGIGTYSVSGTSVFINLSYTNSYVDTSGTNIIQNRSETYHKF